MTRVPRPTVLSTARLPPWASAIDRQIARPSPVPSASRPAPGRPGRTARRRAAGAPAGMPIPVSATTTRACRRGIAAARVIVPPAGVYLIALSSRLNSSRRSWSSSPGPGTGPGRSTSSVSPLASATTRMCSATLADQRRPGGPAAVARRDEPGVLAAEEQELLGQPGQPLDLLQHVLQDPAILLRVAGRAERDLGGVPHHGQRSPQLVGRVGGEPADLLERPLQPRDHAVERPGQPAQLVVGVGDLQPPVEPGGGDLVGRGGHPVDRGQGLAGQQIAAPQRQARASGPASRSTASSSASSWSSGRAAPATWTTSGPRRGRGPPARHAEPADPVDAPRSRADALELELPERAGTAGPAGPRLEALAPQERLPAASG